jgi:hypothetical protein
MTNFRICGLVVAAATLLFATVAQAAVIVAPLESGTSIAKVAQDCGPGGWRGPAPTDAAITVMPGTAGAAPMAACTAGNNLPSCFGASAGRR